MKKVFITSLILLCALEGLMAKATFSGTVIDFKTKEPLVGASVWIPSLNYGLATNALGQFSLVLDSGVYTFAISYMGFKTIEIELNSVEQNKYVFALHEDENISQEVVVEATRQQAKTSSAITINKEDLETVALGQDLPVMLNQAPALVYTSDAGNGVGYTSLRIRGMDQTRINVTVNGIPINDQESHGVFWVNMPDLSSSTQSIQIQRGVGTSTNGGQAFGSSVNIETEHLTNKPYTQINSAFGSFNTLKTNVEAGTGKLPNNWIFTTRLSKITSDGYVDRAYSDLKSFYFSGGRFTDKSILKLTVFSGKEITYQSWYGVTKSEMETRRTYNPYTYENQVDNYQQDHYQLHYSNKIHPKLTLNTALHYTYGRGYYEELREGENLGFYGIKPLEINGSVIEESDIVRQRWLDNDFYGVVASAVYDLKKKEHKNWFLTLGGNLNNYEGRHFGEVIWAQFASNSQINHSYYFNEAQKINSNIYLKSHTEINAKLSASAELQSRWVSYGLQGINDDLTEINQEVTFNFLNPKVSLNYKINPLNSLFAFVGQAGKEPVRNDFISADANNLPKPEEVLDFELGHIFTNQNFKLSTNLYYMDFKNQLVLNGAINDVGAYLRTNVSRSYRAGLELETQWQISPKWLWTANASFSDNRIKEHRLFVERYDVDFNYIDRVAEVYKNTNIAFSPSLVAFNRIGFQLNRSFSFILQSKYVGRQYLDNTQSVKRSLNPYLIHDGIITCNLKSNWFKNLKMNLMLYNISNVLYESNGYTWYYNYDGNASSENWYYPQAGFNFMLGISAQF